MKIVCNLLGEDIFEKKHIQFGRQITTISQENNTDPRSTKMAGSNAALKSEKKKFIAI